MPDSSLTARRIAPVSLYVVALPAYWVERGKPTRPADLAQHACFRYANNPFGVHWRFFGPDSQEVSVRVEGPLCVNNGEVELPALRAGLGVAMIPDFVVHEDIQAGRLERVLAEWKSAELWLHLLTPPGRTQTRRVRAFTDFVVEHFAAGKAAWLPIDQPGREK
jgi:DNA-binding transcriptional LysR family regulator